MKNYKFIALLSLLCLLILIPATYAMDNQTALEVSDEGNVIGDDYYFDSNVENDNGNGSQDNPYKNLTSERVKDNSIIHLSDGEYPLDAQVMSKNITLIGQNPKNTVVKYNNHVGFVADTSITLKNLTLVGLAISDSSNSIINATNVIFKDFKISSISVTSPNTKVYLENCTFLNCSATSGGAISVSKGSLEIVDSLFINNYAERYGGAIYLREAKFIGRNVAIINSTSIMGGAITAVYTNLNLTNVTARNNHAKYSGGAIYALFGSFCLNSSAFIKNTAKDGGALFIDEVNNFIAFNNTFTDNTAGSIAGAVYSAISRNLNRTSILNESLMNSFFNNTASYENDVYECEAINLNYNSSQNYLLIQSGPSYDSDLPSSYDLREYYMVTPVRDQGSNGNCWAFASLASLESCILKATGATYDLSEENMKDLMSQFSSYGWQMETNTGGYDRMGHAYLTSWLGPVNETQDRYIIGEVLSPVLNSIFHIQNILFLTRTSYTDNDEIKRAIMSYGAVSTSIHWYQSGLEPKRDGYTNYYINGKNLYWYRTDKGANHAVAIVGWDDNYSKNNFKTTPPGDGAWIIKNSWGTSSTNDGYYYVSYYDTSLAPLNKPYSTYVFLFNESIKYDKNYQYDVSGRTDFFLNESNTVWYKNRFTATDNEWLTAVSTYFEKNTAWDLSIYVNDVLRHVQSGTATPSYSTIELSSFIPLAVGDVFEVEFKITTDYEASVPISEDIIASGVPINKQLFYENISFISYDGENWVDLYGLNWAYSSHSYASQVACIKAFTVFDEINTTTKLSVNVTDIFEISAQVLNQYNIPVTVGTVTFTFNGNTYHVDVANGVATLKIPLNISEYVVSAQYANEGYISSSDTFTFNTSLLNTSISLVINEYNPINITAYVSNEYGYLINYGNVTFTVDDVPYTVDVINGTATLTKVLSAGKHNVLAVFNSIYYYNSSSKYHEFNVSLVNTEIKMTIFNGFNPVIITVNVTDQYGNALDVGNVTFTVDGTQYVVNVSKGTVQLDYCFKNLGLNNVYATYNGLQYYYGLSNASANVFVNTTIISSDSTKSYNSKYLFVLLDNYGNPLNETAVLVTVGSKNYEIITDENGTGIIDITLSPATYSVTITNPINGEVKIQTIKVVPRISENRDLTMYYGAGKYYTVRVFDDNGNVARNVKVTFTLNNKQYIKTTDDNGYASIKISLKPGKYTITAEYKGFKVSNKITVKSTIITKNIKVKKGKIIKFTAKLLNKNGKIIKNKKITFKFKGKTYKIKTNKRGKAILKITKKVKVGKYTITTIYGKLKVKNTIKIKR
ncbi:C1 family peptidase [Methanobrevibacter sp.]|uniref:C1 family peptidase n=2 Tax=Methanobrevibacter TaxID=2172 RepID=UPI003864929F